MNYKECKEQLEGLIEHFNNGGRDFNATDIIAIKKMLSKIQKQKEVIDKAIDHLDLFVYDENLSKYDFLKILIYTKKILKEGGVNE